MLVAIFNKAREVIFVTFSAIGNVAQVRVASDLEGEQKKVHKRF